MLQFETVYFNHNSNSYLLINNNQCILFDAGFNDNNCLINYINKKGLTLIAIFLTHGHFDHIDGLKSIKNIPVYCHKDEVELFSNPRFNCSFMDGYELIINDINPILVEDNEEINILNTSIKIIHTPFHTAGSVVYYIKELKLLVSGDTLFYHAIGRSDLPTSQPRYIRNSLKKVFSLPHKKDNNTIVYPGHNIKTNLEKEYRFFKNEYLD